MRNKFSRSMLLMGSLFTTAVATAQDANTTDSVMRSNGKIYVVMAVCITILVGLILYLISIDRKIKKIEKNDQ